MSHLKTMDVRTPDPADYARRLLAVQPRLRAYVRSMVFRSGDVDDLLQDVATVGWERFETYNPAYPFDAWLFGVARNLVFQYFEKQRKRIQTLSAETFEQLEVVNQAVSRQATDLQDALEQCLGKLEQHDRRLVDLRYQSGSSNRSVAATTGVSESKISRALNRIYAQLLICIKRQERGQGGVANG